MVCSCQSSLIPAFFFPSSQATLPPWNELVGNTGTIGNYVAPLTPGLYRWLIMSIFPVPFVPGTLFDLNWGAAFQLSHDPHYSPEGTLCIPYINLQFGLIPVSTVLLQFQTANALYNLGQRGTSNGIYLDGFFFDQAPNNAFNYSPAPGGPSSYVAYLQQILAGIIQTFPNYSEMDFWFNMGFWPDEITMNLLPETDINVCFTVENDYATWKSTDIPQAPGWLKNYDGFRIASLAHDASLANMQEGVGLANGVGCNVVYFTDGTQASQNPYGQLPTYWTSEFAVTNC